MQCQHCGQEHPVGTRFCPSTGIAIDAPRLCPSCGKPIESGWKECAYCGEKVEAPVKAAGKLVDKNNKRRTFEPISLFGIAALIMIVVAIFGVLIFHGFQGSDNAVEQPIAPSLPSSKPPASNSQVNPTSVIQPLPKSTSPATSATTTTTATATQCDGDKWTFGPMAVYRYPEGNGFDFTIVDVAVHNGSNRYWGSTTLLFNSIYITTEDGFTYAPFNGIVQGFFCKLGQEDPRSKKMNSNRQRF